VANPGHFTRAVRTVGTCVLGVGVGLALAACGASPSSTAASAASTPAATASSLAASSAPGTSTAPAASATATAAAPSASPSATFVAMQTASGGEFLSPSGNISCEIDYQQGGLTQAYCQTGTPARSVTMTATGSYKACTGQQCLGNPGDGTPTLAYGDATGVGPFRCVSATAGVTCTADGKGFQISTSGVTPVTG
jgi:hypothetical protein